MHILRSSRYYSTRRLISTSYEGYQDFTAAPAPTDAEYARAALEAALPLLPGAK
jgi:hypothetical protein